MKAHHEGFHDVDLTGHFAQGGGFVGIQDERLFAQHVLASASGGERHVQVVGQRVVNSLNAGVFQQGFIRAIGLGNAPAGRRALGLRQRARGYRVHRAKLALLQGRDDFLATDLGGAQHAPTDFFHGKGSLSPRPG